MNSPAKQFGFICLAIAIFMMTAHYYSWSWVTGYNVITWHLAVHPLLGLVYWISFIQLNRSLVKGNRQFVNTFMLATLLRMLSALLMLIPLLLTDRTHGKALAVYFLVSYFIYLGAEVPRLFNLSKRKE